MRRPPDVSRQTGNRPPVADITLYRDLEHFVTQRMLREPAAYEIDQSNIA